MNQEVIIEVRNLVKNFTIGNRTISVLKNINFQIRSGEYIILFGPSGSGKTTLLNLLAGLDRPTAGNIFIRGEDITQINSQALAYHRLIRIGMVFQDFNLIQAMTAVDNVALPLIFANIGYKQRLKYARSLLSDMGLSDRYRHRPIELSGGEQQRVAIARALINNPWILLIDEPTGNLDTDSADEIISIITQLNRKAKRTIILVTHNPDYLGLADRVFSLKDGKIMTTLSNS